MSTVCVHGLGYIGLPTATMLAHAGHDVTGYDTDPSIIEGLQTGNVHIDEPGLDDYLERTLNESFTARSTPVSAEYHIICVPTPFDPTSQSADLVAVHDATDTIAELVEPGDAVILESTVPPGTTAEVVRPRLEQHGETVGESIALAHCPETVLPGNVIAELQANDRIFGCISNESESRIRALYDTFVEGEIHVVSDATTAEMIKLIQNTYRDANIALANEIAKISADYDVDTREAISRANVHPRVDILDPGPGVGGHCLPIDPWFLGHRSEQLELISCARRVNDGMVDYIVDRLTAELGSLQDSRIAILGVAYKANVNDTRRSPGIRLAKRLAGVEAVSPAATMTDGGTTIQDDNVAPTAEVRLCDPRVEDPSFDLFELEEAVEDADAAVLTVAHDEFIAADPTVLTARMAEPLMYDTRGALDEHAWTQAGATICRL